MTTLLIVTAGQADVQIADGDSRCPLFNREIGLLQDELMSRAATDPNAWDIVPAPPLRGNQLDALPASPFHVCTPRLDAVLQYLSDHGLTAVDVLILDTVRSIDSDPRHTATVLAQRIRQVVPDSHLATVSYLSGREFLEDRRNPLDEMIRREVATRIDVAITHAITTCEPQRVVVAPTGGFPIVSSLVEEVTRLRGGYLPVDVLRVPDSSASGANGTDRAVPTHAIPTAAEEFRARRHALELIERGDFLGARGLAEPFKPSNTSGWTSVVGWLAAFAASLPIPSSCDIDVLRHPLLSVRSALRAELALRADDIPRAVHSTVAFFESVLWDALERHGVRPVSADTVVRGGKTEYYLSTPPPAKLVRAQVPTKDDSIRPFRIVDAHESPPRYVIDDRSICATRLVKSYLRSDCIAALDTAVGSARDLRNDVAHNEPTPELMQTAKTVMVGAGLWSSEDTSGRTKLLTQPIIRDALIELGVPIPEDLCDDLLREARARITA